jgi:hypothetical protein
MRPVRSTPVTARRLVAGALLALVAGCAAVARYPSESTPYGPDTGPKSTAAEWFKAERRRPRSLAGFDEFVVVARESMAGGARPDKDLGGPAGLCAFSPTGAEWLTPEHTAITGKVSAALATVTITQRFRNPSAQPADAGYRLLLPHGAAVTDFVLAVGERRIRGIVREREEAERIFEEARRQGYLVSLVGAERFWFAVRLTNLAAGAPVEARATWFCQVPNRDGNHELVIPALGPTGTANPDANRPG